ncbi:MAG: hypothetical protein QF464_14255, partial [Myxococcota bacterium]|nr:hypothetical protein [Myxococcota bacterium]
ELFNLADDGVDVDLSAYEIRRLAGGGEWTDPAFTHVLSGTLAAGKTYVLCDAEAADLAEWCDAFLEAPSVLSFTGDDALALVLGGDVVDQIGEEGPDPGAGWEVAGVSAATKDHVLVRSPSTFGGTTDWANAAQSEWIVQDVADTDLGQHTIHANCVDGDGDRVHDAFEPPLCQQTGPHQTVVEDGCPRGDLTKDGCVTLDELDLMIAAINNDGDALIDSGCDVDVDADGTIDIVDVGNAVHNSNSQPTCAETVSLCDSPCKAYLCLDKSCGDDGCGGSCGTCPGDLSCQNHSCQQ